MADLDLYAEANEHAWRIYVASFEKSPAIKYLEDRGMPLSFCGPSSIDSVESIGFGYAPGNNILSSSVNDPALRESMIQLGLIGYDSEKKRYYDFFRNRVMVPIFSDSVLVGFGGRDISGKSDRKYLNSIDSPIFNKGKNVFMAGDPVAAKEILQVEGYMDAIQLAQHGFFGVATMGTALTEQQVGILLRMSESLEKPLISLYDGDAAGQSALFKSTITAGKVARGGDSFYVCPLYDNLDPDEFVIKFGSESLRNHIDLNSIPHLEYFIQCFDFGSLDEKVASLKKIKDIARDVKNDVFIDALIRALPWAPTAFLSDLKSMLDDAPLNQPSVHSSFSR